MSGDSDFLREMAVGSAQRMREAKSACSEPALLERARAAPQAPALRRHPAGFDLIAELKLRSPAVGQLKSVAEDVHARVSAYANAGAAAVSVLTEPSRFDGTLAHLETAVRALTPLGIPAMRKDFLVDPYQVIEARAAGAGGVLVIVRMLPVSGLRELLDCARRLGLFVLLEAFDEEDIGIMHDLVGDFPGAAQGSLLAGLNCRNLATLQITPQRLIDLAHLLPRSVPRVAESGVASAADAQQLSRAGYEYALIGSALMKGNDPRALAAEILAAGRRR